MGTAEVEARTRCPLCGASVPVHEGWIPWCDCGWNVEPLGRDEPQSLLGRLYRRMGDRHGKALFEELRRREAGRPPVRPSRFVLVALSLAVLALQLGVVAAALWLAVRFWPNPFALAGSLLLLVVAWGVRPRFRRVSRDSLASPATHPELFDLIRRIAEPLEVPAPRRIVLDEGYNAWMGRTGWRQRPTLGLGVPLFHALPAEQQIALVGHELAHLANGDATRGPVVGLAIATLEGWHDVLTPQSLDEVRDQPSQIVGLMLLYGLSWIPRSLLLAIVHLAWHDAQQAEYYADRCAAAVAGTAAQVGLLEAVLDAWMLEDAVHRVTHRKTERGVLEELRHQRAAMPARARERTRRQAAAEPTALDATHPPTGLRIRMLEDRPVARPALTLRRDASDAILREMAPDVRRVEAKLRAEHESYELR